MQWTLVRYKAKPDKVEENAALIEQVFEELRMTGRDDLRYLVLRLPDGGFLHLVEKTEGTPGLSAVEAFRAFQAGAGERSLEPPLAATPAIVGNYRMLME